mgnify:CR=1 FL=1
MCRKLKLSFCYALLHSEQNFIVETEAKIKKRKGIYRVLNDRETLMLTNDKKT